MSMCGLFAGLGGTIEILNLGYYPAVFGTSIGFGGITVALPGRAQHPIVDPPLGRSSSGRCGPEHRRM